MSRVFKADDPDATREAFSEKSAPDHALKTLELDRDPSKTTMAAGAAAPRSVHALYAQLYALYARRAERCYVSLLARGSSTRERV